jgi:homocitrate synthase
MNEQRNILNSFRGVIDSTLREGFQFSKADFSLAEQKKIFAYLLGIGVDFIEVANPAKEEIRGTIRELIKLRGKKPVKVLSHIRNHENDVRMSMEAGVDGINILCTVDAERLAAMGKAPESYRETLAANVRTARENGLEVRVGVEDFFGQPAAHSLAVYRLAESLGVNRLALADTLGKAMPWEVARRVRDLRRLVRTPLEVHFHNDLGHAVGNALAALEAGANYVSTTLLGIGERTGITPLSSFLVNLHVIQPRLAQGYDLSLLTEAEMYIARICGIEMPPHLMTNPKNGFAHKAGIHLDALMKFGPQKYEPLPPALIGNRRNMVIRTLLSGKTTAIEVAAFEAKYG